MTKKLLFNEKTRNFMNCPVNEFPIMDWDKIMIADVDYCLAFVEFCKHTFPAPVDHNCDVACCSTSLIKKTLDDFERALQIRQRFKI